MSSFINYIYNSIYGDSSDVKHIKKYGWKKGEFYGKTMKSIFNIGFCLEYLKVGYPFVYSNIFRTILYISMPLKINVVNLFSEAVPV